MVELIHCHIPKTGGVSFLNIIETIYGKENIAFPWVWLGMVPEKGPGFDMLWHQWPRLKKIWSRTVPDKVSKNQNLRVLQGHHPVGLFDSLLPEAKRIAWVRHPIARVVSNWYHDMNNGYQPKADLLTYAERPENRNVMATYVGHNVDNMDWIGVLERMNRDIHYLAELLGWNEIPEVPHLNKSNRPASFKGYGAKIAKLNEQDMEIYAQVIGRNPEVLWGV